MNATRQYPSIPNHSILQPGHPMAAARMVRRDRYAWPGGYALALLMADGEAVCRRCVADPEVFRLIAAAHRDAAVHGSRFGAAEWQPLALLTAEDEDPHGETCAHCGLPLYRDAASHPLTPTPEDTTMPNPHTLLTEFAEYLEEYLDGHNIATVRELFDPGNAVMSCAIDAFLMTEDDSDDHTPGPECGHSVCSQNFFDTGDRSCVAPAEDDWQALWTPEHQQRACAEGWAIFTVDGDPEIQRIDMIEDDADATPVEPVFGSDACAVAWVLTHAKEGSPLHALALSIHRRTYPEA